MKKSGILLLMCFFVFAGSHGFSQKLKSGDLSALKGQKVINLQFDYSKMKVGKFNSDDEYVKSATADRNNKKPGTGDAWALKWKADQKDRYPAAFADIFNKKAGDCGLELKENATDAAYTLIVHTNFLEQGVEAYVAAKASEVDLVIDLVETKAPDKVIASIEASGKGSTSRMTVGGVPVSKESYDPGERISEAYEAAAKPLGKFFCKELK
ncbi:MAG: hypothetical protein NTU51_05095 [Bacteroidetes bacterium]|nr:hypothetical protein [Bacteroidota bacterium]